MLYELIRKLLVEATKDGLTSISIPALGTGILGFPSDLVAKNMFETCHDYVKNTQTTLTHIVFVVYEGDTGTSKVCI